MKDEGILTWIGERSAQDEDSSDSESEEGGVKAVAVVSDRLKLFKEPAVQAFVDWIQESDDEDEDDDDDDEEEDESEENSDDEDEDDE